MRRGESHLLETRVIRQQLVVEFSVLHLLIPRGATSTTYKSQNQ